MPLKLEPKMLYSKHTVVSMAAVMCEAYHTTLIPALFATWTKKQCCPYL